MRQCICLTAALLLGAVSLLAGPPAICHPIDIGTAKSLPWAASANWNSPDPGYDVSRLPADTLAILTPSAPLNVRMETIRRAAIYAVKKEGLVSELAAQLLARAANSDASGKPDAMAWFDAGYFAEAMRQMAFTQRFMKDDEQAQWRWDGETWTLDGKPWIDHAGRLGARGLSVALEKVEEMRRADLKRMQAARTTNARR
jgi:hypothetical protein